MKYALDVSVTPCNIVVTDHAKQRLYDRFGSLCFGRGDFGQIITDAICASYVTYCDEATGEVKFQSGDMLFCAVKLKSVLIVKTVLDVAMKNEGCAKITTEREALESQRQMRNRKSRSKGGSRKGTKRSSF